MAEQEFRTERISVKLLHQNTGQIEDVPRNPRFIRDEKFEKLKQSLSDDPEMTNLRECLVYDNNGEYVVIGGNMRLRAAKELGWEELPCKILPSDTPAKKLRAYAIKDNNSYGDTDWEILSEWDAVELEDWGVDVLFNEDVNGELPIEVEEDDFDEAEDEVESRCKVGDVWQLGRHRLMCGDSTKEEDVATLMNGQQVKLLLTDPPYNVDYHGGTKDEMTIANDNLKEADFIEFLTKALRCAVNSMEAGAAFYIWHADGKGYLFHTSCREVGLTNRETLIWVKNGFVLGRQDYQWRHEPCLYGWKDGAAHYFINDRKQSTVFEDAGVDYHKLKKDELLKIVLELTDITTPNTILYENKPLANDIHPTMKPVKLMARLIQNSTKQEWSVLDLFGGSGTTLIACEQLNRKCFMMEYSTRYCDAILARWEKLTGQEAVKIK